MLEAVAEFCTITMITKGVIEEKKKDIYIYGFQLFFSTISSILSMVILSVITGNLKYGIIYLCVFMSLRITANGYHANTYCKCFILTNSLFLLYLSVVRLIPVEYFNYKFNILILFICFIYISLKAPIEHPNHILSLSKKGKNKLAAMIIAGIIICIIYFSHMFFYYDVAYAMTVAMYIVILMMVVKNREPV